MATTDINQWTGQRTISGFPSFAARYPEAAAGEQYAAKRNLVFFQPEGVYTPPYTQGIYGVVRGSPEHIAALQAGDREVNPMGNAASIPIKGAGTSPLNQANAALAAIPTPTPENLLAQVPLEVQQELKKFSYGTQGWWNIWSAQELKRLGQEYSWGAAPPAARAAEEALAATLPAPTLAPPATPTPPKTPTPTPQPTNWANLLNQATTVEQARVIREDFEAAYASGKLDYGTYENLYNQFIAKVNSLQQPTAVIPALSPTPTVTIPTPTPTPNINPSGGGVGTVPYGPQEDIYGPFASYMQRLGLGQKNYLTPHERYLENLFAPLQGIYNLKSRLATTTGNAVPGLFANYAAQLAQGTGDISQQANELLGRLTAATPEQRAIAGATYEPSLTEAGGLAVSEAELGATAELREILRQALMPQLGMATSSWLSKKLPQEQQKWWQAKAAGQQENFLDYLFKKYNLGNLMNVGGAGAGQ